MAFKFTPGALPFMPVFFGPAYSQNTVAGAEATKNGYFKPADVNCLSISYETDRELLEECIPECYTLREPIISVNVCEFNYLGWANGKKYNLININCPVHFKGELDDVDGDLVLVMFENHCDPILGGREGMGYAKILCDIPDIQYNGIKYTSLAFGAWGGKFMKIQCDMNESPDEADKQRVLEVLGASEGKMHLKTLMQHHHYTDPQKFTVDIYPTMLPNWVRPEDYPWEIMEPKCEYGTGTIDFTELPWDEWPTFGQISKGLAKLPVKKVLLARHMEYNDPCIYNSIFRLK